MQYKSCQKCKYQGNRCQMVMAQAMKILSDLEYLIKYAQPRMVEEKCKIRIDYTCENFTPKGEHDAE